MREGCWGGMEDIGSVMVGLLAGCYDKRVGVDLLFGGGGGVVEVEDIGAMSSHLLYSEIMEYIILDNINLI